LDQNYFDLGGDSSLTIQLFVQIEKTFGVKVPVVTLFEAPTVRELATAIQEARSDYRK
jgi:acyl carrier protein